MEDIYDTDYSMAETAATVVLLHELSKNSSSENTGSADYTENWNRIKKRGSNGFLAGLVRLNTYLYIVVLLLVLAYCFAAQVLGISF